MTETARTPTFGEAKGEELGSPEKRKPTAVERYGVQSAQDLMNDVLVRSQSETEQRGAPIGVTELDSAMCGLRPGHITVVGADTSWGKSSFALLIADCCLADGFKPLIVTCEDVPSMWGQRLTARRTGLRADSIRDNDIDEVSRARIAHAVADAQTTPLILNGVQKSAEWHARAISELVAEVGYDVVIYDYLQKAHMGQRTQDRRTEVAKVCSTIGDAIKQAEAAGVILSQLKRPGDGGRSKPPDLHDLKESGDIENMAEHIILGWGYEQSEEQYGEDVIHVEKFCSLAKNKDGQKIPKIELKWVPSTASFQRTTGYAKPAPKGDPWDDVADQEGVI